MKHKHADLIHAWADGAEIQIQGSNGEWSDVLAPQWTLGVEYRIKPEEKKPVVRWLWAYQAGDYWHTSETYFSEQEFAAMEFTSIHIKLEWSRTEFPE